MRRTLVVALAMVGLAGSAHGADMGLFTNPPQFKDPLPDSLTWYGVTFFATLDVGYAYQTNGRPLGAVVSGLEFIPFTTTRNYTGQRISTIAENGLQQSNFGLKVDTPIGQGWNIVGRLDTGFDPLTGKLSDGCSSFIQNAGVVYNQQNSNADSGRCGQALNGSAFGGVSNKQYGTLTIGRQNSFQLDAIAAYDPMALSYAFSLLGYSGTNGGSGSTQAARWDDSAKYVYDFGPISAGAMYSNGGSNTGMFGSGYGFFVGGAYGGFSAEAVYTKEHGAVNLQTAVNDVFGSQTLAANISDNTAWSVMGKYTFEFGRPSTGGYPTKAAKAEAPADKLTFFAGYTHIDQANPSTPVGFGGAAGGYLLTVSGTLPDNNAFTTDKILQFFWVGAKYEFAWGLGLTGAYYHVNQNSYVADGAGCILGGASKLDCAGSFDQVSFLADYIVTKHLDVYAGITYGKVQNGLASAFPGTPGAKFGFAGTATSIDTTSMMTGFRIKI
ncbi:MAG: porin [Bradyrhizobium sp.]|uniref:porin n=1 Tax=Bradyrhizobium sp. TaxID=376 RepID=UPI001229AE31|nr:porin [Bradyrhizobium sp.]THD47778.1 MAG: porin [Bradyrhizobium sp.]